MYQEFEEEPTKSLSDYLSIVKRRRKVIVWTGSLLALAGLLLALLLPATYRSTAVILIESQDVPPDLIRSTVTSYAVQRIEEIRQRILTTSNIMSIVERFELYDKKELQRKTRTEISKEFRDNLEVEPISADVIDPRSGSPTQAVIAFKLSYDGENAQKVFKVTNELITLYLNENLRGRTEQSNSTSDFLSGELASMDEILKDLENKLSEFKQNNQGSLPELNNYNMSVIDRSQQDIININSRIQELESRKIELESQLAQMNPSAPVILPDGQAVLSDADRLRSLQSEYRRKSALYNADHPDLIRIVRELDALLKTAKIPNDKKDLAKELQTLKNQYATLKEQYVEDHPDIVKIKNQMNVLEDEMLTLSMSQDEFVADNPSYVLLNTQLKSVLSEMVALKDKQKEIQLKISHHEELLLKAPTVERDYQLLLREYESTRLKYHEISEKQLHAELGKNLEQERKGERFTLIQPPEVPEEPVSVNRFALLLISIVVAILAGLGAGLAAEAVDKRVYGEKALERITGIAAIAVVPYLTAEMVVRDNKKLMIYLIAIALVSLAVALTLFNFFIKPLDVTWFLLMHKLGLR